MIIITEENMIVNFDNVHTIWAAGEQHAVEILANMYEEQPVLYTFEPNDEESWKKAYALINDIAACYARDVKAIRLIDRCEAIDKKAGMLQDTVSKGVVILENATGKDVTNSQVLRTIFPDMSWYEVMGEGNMLYVTKVNKQKGTQWERKALTYNTEWGNMPYKGV